MANLWRTQRPRFPLYISDGNGRDYYIKYNNAGYWDNENMTIQKKPDYECQKFNNFHSLIHQAAPCKYIPTGNGRETYIINAGGLYHDEKPLASYKLDDFLRGSNSIENPKIFKSRKKYLSLGEKRYNEQLQNLEKQLIKRLYKIHKNSKKHKTIEGNENILPYLNKNNDDDNTIKNEKLNSIENIQNFSNKFSLFNDNKKRKINKMTLKNNFASIVRQSQQIEKYEMKNNSRRSNNECDYNSYQNGRVGCRINGLKSLVNCPSESWKYNNRMNSEGNKVLRYGKINKRLKKNKLTFDFGSSCEEKNIDSLK